MSDAPQLDHPQLDDPQLLQGFEDATLPLEQWDHRAHLKVAYLYVQRLGMEQAIEKMRAGLLHFLEVKQIPTGPDQGYHETLTVAWLRLVAAMREIAGPFDSADDFCDSQKHLLNKYALLFFYSRDRIMSAEARARFLPPDLAPFPTPPADPKQP